ncbi:MAG: hypothetical protein JWL65_5722 [Gammaproteobacteria bacterium]|nr:hypothetical protein [Gammaproteobacteria bacterium]
MKTVLITGAGTGRRPLPLDPPWSFLSIAMKSGNRDDHSRTVQGWLGNRGARLTYIGGVTLLPMVTRPAWLRGLVFIITADSMASAERSVSM